MDTQNTQGANPDRSEKTSLAVPVAIVIAGALIAFAMYSKGPSQVAQNPTDTDTGDVAGAQATAENMKPVSDQDHILGNPSAQVKIVEYSDTECPFCKRFHPTLHQIMDEYGKDGRVAWVYRHFPIPSLHQKAIKEAEATECVAKLGGNEKFWAYIDKIYEVTPANDGLDAAQLPVLAAQVGVDRAEFEKCLSSGEFTQKINESMDEAVKAGAQGTPYAVVVAQNGKQFIINGALPYESVKQTVEAALAEK